MKYKGFYLALSLIRIVTQNFRPLKLTVPVSFVSSTTLPHLLGNTSLHEIGIQSTAGYTLSTTIRGEEFTTTKKCQCGSNYDINYLALLNAGGNILFSTTLSKASVELPFLATGLLCPGKNKVPGEATNLRFVKV